MAQFRYQLVIYCDSQWIERPLYRIATYRHVLSLFPDWQEFFLYEGNDIVLHKLKLLDQIIDFSA